MSLRPVKIIAGPTASGKTAHAIDIGLKEDGVVINADSMQIYDALPMLSAQPDEEERAQIAHYLYAALPPQDKCSAARWRALALAEIDKAHAAGKLPLIVGGTGFYIKALIDGLSPIPDVPDDIRTAAEALQRELGNPGFHAALAEKDPEMAERLHPNDTQRLVRAWEVFAATGKSLAYWQAQPPADMPEDLLFDIMLVMPEKAVLDERCHRRFDRMIAQGVMDEVRELDGLISDGTVPEDAAITNALGFHPLRAYLKEQLSLEEAIERSKIETCQYAKRQGTWFRNQIRPNAGHDRVANIEIIG